MKKLLTITICCFCLSTQAMKISPYESSSSSTSSSMPVSISTKDLMAKNQEFIEKFMEDPSKEAIVQALIAQNTILAQNTVENPSLNLEENADSSERISTVDKVIRETERIVEQVKSWAQDTGKRLEGFGQKAGKDVEKVGQNLGAAAEKTGREVRRFFRKF